MLYKVNMLNIFCNTRDQGMRLGRALVPNMRAFVALNCLSIDRLKPDLTQ